MAHPRPSPSTGSVLMAVLKVVNVSLSPKFYSGGSTATGMPAIAPDIPAMSDTQARYTKPKPRKQQYCPSGYGVLLRVDIWIHEMLVTPKLYFVVVSNL